ncbi:putative enoyl-CoA hydratase/isomerase, ClpP/crotonase-like domain superfamily [Septoria linicola]|nr:putative enoyl-CoA hydratase/isomerase, ClpP/crotonase-like domain superfamily [Septoria linicola]
MSNNKESQYQFPELLTTFPALFVAHVQINRPKKYNAISPDVFHSLASVFDKLSTDEDVRAILLSGVGQHFSAGLDVTAASSSGPVSKPSASDDIARRTWKVRRHVYDYQNGMNAIERCEKPVICLLHGVVYGAGIDIAVAADVRYCASGVKFSVKEVDVGLAADVGTLTRLPKIGVSYSWAKEVVYTARVFGAEEAEKVGFVSKVVKSKDDLMKEGMELAELIATKSPVAVQSSKALLDFSRDRPVADGLAYTAVWNAAMVQSEDVTKAMMSGLKKTKTTFEKL